MKPRPLWGALLFSYGALVHLILFRALVHWRYGPPTDTAFVNHPLTNIGMAACGGLLVSFLMLRLLRRAARSEANRPLRIVARGGLYGILATSLVIELLLMAAAVTLTASTRSTSPDVPLFAFFRLYLISVHAYSLDVFVEAIPFSFLYGAIAAGLVLWMHRRSIRFPDPGTRAGA